MALAACKVVINSGLLDDMQTLASRVKTYERLTRDPNHSVADKFYQQAIDIDTELRECISDAIDKYDALNLSLAESV